MSTHGPLGDERISPAAIAEASRWFALLHGPDRSPDADILFRRWSAASPENEAAYDLVTNTWERTRELPKPPLPLPRKWQRAGFRSGFVRAVTTVGVVASIAVVAVIFYVYSAGIRTDVGEQRSITLEDGTRVSLNTDTQVVVRYDKHRRNVALRRGEALFEVAPQPERPFVVTAHEQEVTALGTVFLVRDVAGTLAVTLMEGRIAVAPAREASATAARQTQTLEPGQRVVFEQASPPRVDRPEVEKVTAWRRGRVEMERTPLYAAAIEMNRYSAVKIVVERPEAQVIPVSGSFRSGDVLSFADTLVRACQLEIERRPEEIVLRGVPSPNCR